ncbi:MAG: L-rhamnose/proton symporter RhaT [Candidatus Latescibacteria bacterium]|jgi:L-rhamnose-H+ transport protein|nr:L-rhamnose/proton symporter RhaT [Candidatus Latescibacterota bacterium]
MNPISGVFLHALGGLSAGSFYIPFRKVRNWAWESYWIVSGFAAWIVAPCLMAFLTVPDLMGVFRSAPAGNILACYIFGVLWGVGGMTFGLTMRYLGMSLGYALALGNCAAFGTIIPPVYFGTFDELTSTASGLVTLGGVMVCLVGIAICGRAGISKERELTVDQKRETIREFDFRKGVFIAIICGIMSACFAFGIAAGKPIAVAAKELGTGSLWVNNPVFIPIMVGGFTTNVFWCVFLNIKNRTGKDYITSGGASLLHNYMFSSLAGIIWYFQFLFYGMGTTKMGKYDFSSWSIHMAFIIVFSNIWGLIFREWKGSSRRTLVTIVIGILVLIVSTCVIGSGNYLASLGK